MPVHRLETFSDGVIAIIITIMMLEMKIPQSAEWADLMKVWPIFISYILSFIKVGIYWKNHHHLLHTIDKVNNSLIWSNLAWLFLLSLLPFTTGWMGENHFAPLTVAVYSLNLLLAALTYGIVRLSVIREQTAEHRAAEKKAMPKGTITVLAYCVAVPAALLDYPVISGALIVGVAVMWLVSDPWVESGLRP